MNTEERQFDPITAAQHYTLYENICRIPDGREFLHAVNEGIKKKRELEEELKQRDETIKELREEERKLMAYKVQAYEQLIEIKALKEALKEIIPLAEIGLQYESQRFYDKYNPIVDKARKLIED